MADVDAFASQLLEEAKRFLEKAVIDGDAEGESGYLHAALNLAFSALEAHVNSIADDFLVRSDLSLLDRSILTQLPQLAPRSNEFCSERKTKFLKSFDVSLETRV